jgi:hypothetical protein
MGMNPMDIGQQSRGGFPLPPSPPPRSVFLITIATSTWISGLTTSRR